MKLVQETVMHELEASEVDLVFMQDNARPHTAKILKQYYDENDVELLDWPPQSPDLNPFEHIWAVMKQDLYTQGSFPTSKADLIERFLTIWDNLELQIFENLSDSIPDQLKLAIQNKGGWI